MGGLDRHLAPRAALLSRALSRLRPAARATKTEPPGARVISCGEGYTYRKAPSTCAVDPTLAAQRRALPEVTGFVDCTQDAAVCNGYRFATCQQQIPGNVDETNHARLCFGLASTYAGRAIGPGPLDIALSLEHTSLLDVYLVLAEGCFGETSAALEALELLESSKDPAIVEAYRVIVADEQRHAELAFRFVAWALEQEPRVAERIHAALRDYPTSPEVRSVVATCFDALLERRVAA